MYRLNIPTLIVFLALCACTNNEKSEEEKSKKSANSELKEEALPIKSLTKDPRKIGPEKGSDQIHIEKNLKLINTSENPLFGFWVGAFGKNKINIALSNVSGDSIFGHSVCAGNFRPIKGSIIETGERTYKVYMREPGDDKYDGEFHFTIDLDAGKLVGNWQPYKNTVKPKTYELVKREYTYDPNIGDYPTASKQWYEVPDVENLLPEEAEMIRNEIYARHGYSFTNLKVRRIFDAKEWYIPISVDIREELTDLEAHNIDILYNYEDYYEDYYNEFGR